MLFNIGSKEKESDFSYIYTSTRNAPTPSSIGSRYSIDFGLSMPSPPGYTSPTSKRSSIGSSQSTNSTVDDIKDKLDNLQSLIEEIKIQLDSLKIPSNVNFSSATISRFFPSPPSTGNDITDPSPFNLTRQENGYTTMYYDVAVYVPYSNLRKQLRRHGVPSSLILNMFYRKGGIVEIVTYLGSIDALASDLAKLANWTWARNYDPIMGSCEIGNYENREEFFAAHPFNEKDLHSVCQTYLTTVHSAILTSNGSESLKNYYQQYGKMKCKEFISDAQKIKKIDDQQIDLNAIWNSSQKLMTTKAQQQQLLMLSK